ncbi:ABC transporter substrate-binding protein [Inquilinus limosus]|uniref:ABC transporter substrate-binding protein n=1 Tax=Inquilinus limosus TaxID=171674 RepID=UPI00047E1016|nr:sugar ABC transporter substrate-binding protein [Inquilinus limosus]
MNLRSMRLGPSPLTSFLGILALAAGLAGPALAETTEIRFFIPGASDEVSQKTLPAFIADFEAKNPDIKVKVEGVGWDEAFQKLSTDFIAGRAADVVYIGTRNVAEFSMMGAIQPVDGLVDAATLARIPETLRAAAQFGGKQMAVPMAFSTQALYYRTDLIPTPPKTWDELVATAKAVMEKNPGMYGYATSAAAHVTLVSQFLNFVYQNGGEAFDSSGETKLNSPEAVGALQFYVDLFQKDKIVPNPLELNREQHPPLFAQGKIAMMVSGPWGRSIMGLDPDNKTAPYAVAPLPCGKVCKGEQVSDSLAISAKSQHPEAAGKFVAYLLQPDVHAKWDDQRGLVPLLAEEEQLDTFKTPFWQTFITMKANGFAQPTPKAWQPFEKILVEAVQSAILGKATPQEALDAAAEKIRKARIEPRA